MSKAKYAAIAASSALAKQQKSWCQNIPRSEDMLQPTVTSPIKSVVELLDLRITQLQATVDQLFICLKPVTAYTDDNVSAEIRPSKAGNSPLNIDLNVMADRLEVITTALQLQVDRLEV